MKDFRDEPLIDGDKVAYIGGYSGGRYYLKVGYIKRVTPKGATVVMQLADMNERYAGFFVKSARLVKL